MNETRTKSRQPARRSRPRLLGLQIVRSCGAIGAAAAYLAAVVFVAGGRGVAFAPHPGWLAAALTAILGACFLWKRQLRDAVASAIAGAGGLAWVLGLLAGGTLGGIATVAIAGFASTAAVVIAAPALLVALLFDVDPIDLDELGEEWARTKYRKKKKRRPSPSARSGSTPDPA